MDLQENEEEKREQMKDTERERKIQRMGEERKKHPHKKKKRGVQVW